MSYSCHGHISYGISLFIDENHTKDKKLYIFLINAQIKIAAKLVLINCYIIILVICSAL